MNLLLSQTLNKLELDPTQPQLVFLMFVFLCCAFSFVFYVSSFSVFFMHCIYANLSIFCIFSQSVSLTQYVVLSACVSVRVSLLSKRPSLFCLIHFRGALGAARGQKTTFNGRQPLREDDLCWKPLMDDDL